MQTLGSVHKDLHELEIHTGRIQASVGQVSVVQVSLTQASMRVPEVERTRDLRIIPLLEGSLQTDNHEDHSKLEKFKAIGINVVVFPLESLHALHQGVSDELQIKEQHALAVPNECKLNNPQMYEEKTQTLKEKEEIKARGTNLELVIEQACQTVPKLHIPDDAQCETKVRKLVVVVRNANDEVGRVTFEFPMKIV